MPVSNRVKDLYTDMYAGGGARDWRDIGAIDKAANIGCLWRQAGLVAEPRVIEIGSGEGAVAEALARQHFFREYVGFELSESGVVEAGQRQIPDARFELISGDGMPVEDDAADVVIMSHVVEHLEHPRQLLYEARRIAPYIVVEVPLELNSRMSRDYIWDDLGHINKYTSTSIRHLVQTCGFEVVDQFTMNPSKAVSNFYQRSRKRTVEWHLKDASLKITPRLARTLFTYHEAILARRSA